MAQQEEVKLPKGWVDGTASDLVLNPKNDIVDGPFGSNLKASEYTDSGTPIVRIQNVKRFRFVDKNIHFVTDAKAEQLKRHSFQAGDVLITKLGEPLGLACIAPKKLEYGIIVADIVRARPYVEISNKFMTYLLNSKVVIEQISKHTKGSTRARINLGVVRNLEVPIPPLPEQKRIVEKLDSLLAQVDTIQQRLNNLPNIIKRFRQSVLAAAVSGKLTEQWRGENDIAAPEKSCLNKLGRVYGGKTPSKSRSAFWEDGSIPWVSPKDMKVYEIGNSKDLITDLALSDGGMSLVPKGSILMVTRSGILAHTFPVALTVCELTINQDIKAFTPNFNKISSEFSGILMKGLSHRILDECSKVGTTVSSVETDKLVTLSFDLPQIKEQTEIVRLVEQYFALADTLEKNLANAKQRVDNLTQSILAKAFKGELVPQDPNDEPADKLLERIKAARLEAEKLEKAAKKAAKASKVKKK